MRVYFSAQGCGGVQVEARDQAGVFIINTHRSSLSRSWSMEPNTSVVLGISLSLICALCSVYPYVVSLKLLSRVYGGHPVCFNTITYTSNKLLYAFILKGK